jgi:hypothetical protein
MVSVFIILCEFILIYKDNVLARQYTINQYYFEIEKSAFKTF